MGGQQDGSGRLIVACGALSDEVLAVAGGTPVVFCEGRLHDHPERLLSAVEAAIEEKPEAHTVLLTYGQCSNGLVGLQAGRRTIVLPAVDDCVSLLLGSRKRYLEEFNKHPGTYYYTRGWVEEIDDPYQVYLKLVPKYGADTAAEFSRMELASYERVCLIDTGTGDLEQHEPYVRTVAEFYGLRMDRLNGSLRLIRKLVTGPHDDEFIVVKPGETLTEAHFWEAAKRLSGS